jgi:hypothetical protein
MKAEGGAGSKFQARKNVETFYSAKNFVTHVLGKRGRLQPQVGAM